MVIEHVIFDLDGTLIDSSHSILKSFEAAFKVTQTPALRAFTPDVIGPPLIPTLKLLSGSEDAALLQRLAEAFKAEYDSHAYQLAEVFEGVETMLQSLHAQGVKLYIATNKRIYPTRKIMQFLGWEGLFTQVYALDFFTPALPNKTAMVTEILAQMNLNPTNTVFVGDRIEDGQAATVNHLPFAMVSWGYLDDTVGEIPSSWQRCETPQQLLNFLSQ